jgi:hypothetical protein
VAKRLTIVKHPGGKESILKFGNIRKRSSIKLTPYISRSFSISSSFGVFFCLRSSSIFFTAVRVPESRQTVSWFQARKTDLTLNLVTHD